jgi:hypothetical protein
MDLKEVAKGLIEAVDGEVNDEMIDGVVTVFNGIKRGVNETWEQHLADDTNDILMYDKICCPDCGKQVVVARTWHKIIFDEQ